MKYLISMVLLAFATQLFAAEDAQGWYDRAVSERESGRLEEAQKALENAESLGFSPGRIAFERARQQAIAGDQQAAVAQLKKLADGGFTQVGVIVNDDILGNLVGVPAFDTLVEELSIKAFPCEHDSRFAEFDFWLGHWDVHIAGGTFAGSNVIERTQRGCLLTENWNSASGGTGSSVNYVDKATGEWVQIWNDSSGSQINIRGGLTDDGMLLTGTIHYVSNGTTAPFRGLWTPLPDGRVRQFFEQSNDDGETWVNWFEGFYTRRATD